MDEQNKIETPMPLAEAGEKGVIEAERGHMQPGPSLYQAAPPAAGAEPVLGRGTAGDRANAAAVSQVSPGENLVEHSVAPDSPVATTAAAADRVWKSRRKRKAGAKPERPGAVDMRADSFAEKVWKPYLHPIVALVVICVVTSFLLGLTNNLTAPLIEQNTIAAANAARQALLPEADGFEAVPITADAPNVTAMYRATNDTGYVIEAWANGYGGKVPAMVALDGEGTILGVTFLQNSETPGLGKKLETDAGFAAQFAGLPGQPVSAGDIDKIASATVSTNAAVAAVNAATALFSQQVLGVTPGALTPEQVLDQLAGATPPTAITISAEGVQPTAYKTSYGYIIYGEAQGVHSTVVAAVAMNGDGVVEDLWLDTGGEGAGYGDGVGSNNDFLAAFKEQTAPVAVDAVSGGTLTSQAAVQAVDNALAALPAAKEAG